MQQLLSLRRTWHEVKEAIRMRPQFKPFIRFISSPHGAADDVMQVYNLDASHVSHVLAKLAAVLQGSLSSVACPQ